MNRLSDISSGRENNVTVMKFVAAFFVILTHSFFISLGNAEAIQNIALKIVTHFSYEMTVSLFFFFSGFYIVKSLKKSKNDKAFWVNRCSRIFPGLAVVTFVMALLIGPFISDFSIQEYLISAQTYKYLLNALMVLVHDLPGVFTNNAYGSTVNGVLWTLPIEILCCVLLWAIHKVGLLNEKGMLWLTPLFYVGLIIIKILLGSNWLILSALRPAGMFYAGAVCQIYAERIAVKPVIAWMSVALFEISVFMGISHYTCYILLSYFMLYVAYGTKNKLVPKKLDCYYEMYLIGWPIQQIVCLTFGGSMNPYLNLIIAFPIIMILSFLMSKYISNPISNYVRSKLC